MKADSANREIMSFTDGGEQCSMYYLRARTQEDLRRRMRAHRMIADILKTRTNEINGLARVLGFRVRPQKPSRNDGKVFPHPA